MGLKTRTCTFQVGIGAFQTRSFEDVQLCYLVISGMAALRNITKYYKVLQIITKYCNVIQRLTNTNTKD